ncbi:hypothetical protein EAO71_04170 [Streptomyces sp. ms191]|uniref:DUF3817 domain-containing protein n=1 Tax=unclassified Streptomyces TaxID=2593676 RepID=UPI0011CE142A|nr:DUF3817 domain-containing protein [Streptomyces sp. ms191]TXS32769.1 hypothetical protein EAO71_04170 [Streptomyces sp. ms191]
MRTLRIAAAVEAVSLALLLLNLVTVHAEAVTSLGGPVHGTAYLAVVLMVWLTPSLASTGARWRALVPGVGGLLVLRRSGGGVVAGEG